MKNYNNWMKLMHWLLSFIIIAEIALGFYMSQYAPAPFKFWLYGLHKSCGVLVMGLVILRTFVRSCSKIPPLPHTISTVETLLSRITVLLLYALMIIMPLSGYLMSSYAGYEVHFFSIALPQVLATDLELAGFFSYTHTAAGWTLALLVALHALSVLKHLAFDKVNLLRRIT